MIPYPLILASYAFFSYPPSLSSLVQTIQEHYMCTPFYPFSHFTHNEIVIHEISPSLYQAHLDTAYAPLLKLILIAATPNRYATFYICVWCIWQNWEEDVIFLPFKLPYNSIPYISPIHPLPVYPSLLFPYYFHHTPTMTKIKINKYLDK